MRSLLPRDVKSGLSPAMRHIMAGIGYALGYQILREVSFSHWSLFSGFRLLVLLLMPFRFWPALIVGETIPLAYNAFFGFTFGTAWSLFMMVPPVALAMPVVHWFRRDGRMLSDGSLNNVNMLLLCTASVSAIWSLVDCIAAYLAEGPPGWDYTAYGLAGTYFLGNYLGVMTIVPVSLAIRTRLAGHSIGSLADQILGSRLALELMFLLLPLLALLRWVAMKESDDVANAARMAMFLPVAWVALRHGWEGAAAGGAAASLALLLAMPGRHDAGTIQAEVFVSLTITTMLALGARIAALKSREMREIRDVRAALALAQRNAVLDELQLRSAARKLLHFGQVVELAQGALVSPFAERARDALAPMKLVPAPGRELKQLADDLYPIQWQELGMANAIKQGPLASSLARQGIALTCNGFGERVFFPLSAEVQTMVYRVACDLVGYLCSRSLVHKIGLRMRAGHHGGRSWVVVRVSAIHSPQDSLASWRKVDLSESPPDLRTLRDRVAAFEGVVRVRSTSAGTRVIALMIEPAS